MVSREEITRERYGVEEPKYRRFRYGVQVNSLGLTEQQPENNVYRILIEMLAVTLSKKALAAQIAAAGDLFVGAFEGERLVGSALGSVDGRAKGWINRVAVDPDRRRRGLGLRRWDWRHSRNRLRMW